MIRNLLERLHNALITEHPDPVADRKAELAREGYTSFWDGRGLEEIKGAIDDGLAVAKRQEDERLDGAA